MRRFRFNPALEQIEHRLIPSSIAPVAADAPTVSDNSTPSNAVTVNSADDTTANNSTPNSSAATVPVVAASPSPAGMTIADASTSGDDTATTGLTGWELYIQQNPSDPIYYCDPVDYEYGFVPETIYFSSN